MDMIVEHMAGDITKLVLRGRFDTTSAVAAELPFNEIGSQHRKIIVDLSAVNFLSSYGIRLLLVGAKTVHGSGGKLVIVCPEKNVLKVLNTAGTDALIPIFETDTAAADALRA
jgi:anti-sigma B factor antagonist